MHFIVSEEHLLAQKLKDIGLCVLADRGQNVRLRCGSGCIRIASIGFWGLALVTPFSGIDNTPRPYGFEVRRFGRDCVFSYWWTPVLVRTFNMEEWIEVFYDYEFHRLEEE